MVLNSTHAFNKAHATVAITVFSCLSEHVEQFEVSHQAQLVGWQDLLEWNRRDAEQEPKHFLVKRNVSQTHVAQRQGRNETSLICSLPHYDITLNTLFVNTLPLCSMLVMWSKTLAMGYLPV